MAFAIYRRTVTDSRVRYERVQPLRLSGASGLIARHVHGLPDEEASSWKLTPGALRELAGHPAAADDLVTGFDITGLDASGVCLYELRCIHGSCRDTSTQLALDFAVVVDGETGGAANQGARLEVATSSSPKRLSEILSLTGGPAGGDWKWDAPPLRLGATVVGHAPCG